MSETTTQVNAPISDKQQFDLISAQLYSPNGGKTLLRQKRPLPIAAFYKKTTLSVI